MFAINLQKLFRTKNRFGPISFFISLIFLFLFSLKAAASATVDVAVFYTSEVLKQMNLEQLHQLVSKRTQVANQALIQAKVPLTRALVAFEPSPIAQRAMFNTREFLANRQRHRKITELMDSFGADYATIVTTLSDNFGCGWAQVGGRVSLVIVSPKCNAGQKDYLLAHEWGHLDGAAHSEKDSARAKLKYGVGYVCDGLSTIMNMQTLSSKKQLIYSQADSCGKQGVADVARLIKERIQLPGAVQNTAIRPEPLAQVSISTDYQFYSERTKVITGWLSLSQPLAITSSVQLYTFDIDTRQDFKPVQKRIEFKPGCQRVRFEVELVDDLAYEANEKMGIGLRYPKYLNIARDKTIVTIVSDDGP